MVQYTRQRPQRWPVWGYLFLPGYASTAGFRANGHPSFPLAQAILPPEAAFPPRLQAHPLVSPRRPRRPSPNPNAHLPAVPIPHNHQTRRPYESAPVQNSQFLCLPTPPQHQSMTPVLLSVSLRLHQPKAASSIHPPPRSAVPLLPPRPIDPAISKPPSLRFPPASALAPHALP